MKTSYGVTWSMLLGLALTGVWPATVVAVAADDTGADVAVDEAPPGPPEDMAPPGDGPGGQRRGRGGERFREMRASLEKWDAMSVAEREALDAFVQEHYPEMHEMMEKTEARDERGFRRRLARVLPHLLHMQALKQEDPERFAEELAEQKRELELRRLTRQYRTATDEAEKARLAEAIRPLVADHFDAHQRRMEEEVRRLETRLTRLREDIAEQAENREAEIEAIYQRILEGKPPRFGPPGRGHDGDRPGFGKGRGRHRGRGRGPGPESRRPEPPAMEGRPNEGRPNERSVDERSVDEGRPNEGRPDE